MRIRLLFPLFLHRVRYTTPTGHIVDKGSESDSPWDQAWAEEFMRIHGQVPCWQDWVDFLFTLEHPGTALGGAWTSDNWETYTRVRDALGPLLRARGHTEAGWLQQISGGMVEATGWGVDGPDGTFLVEGCTPDGMDAWTHGNRIVLKPGFVMRLDDTMSGKNPEGKDFARYQALVSHEYVHVLQERDDQYFLVQYFILDRNAYKDKALEVQAYKVGDNYYGNPWLPGPWEFPTLPWQE